MQFPSWPSPLFLSEVKCEATDINMIFFILMLIKLGFAPSLVLKVRVFETRKWPIVKNTGELTQDTWVMNRAPE